MRVFIVGLGSTLSDELVRQAQDAGLEVVGTVSTKTQQSRSRRKLLAHPSNDHELAVAEPVALQSDRAAWSKLVQKSDVVVASLVEDAKAAIDTLRVFEKPKPENDENDENDEDPGGAGLKRFIAISSVLTWSRNPPLAKGDDGPTGHREDDFKTRKPAPAYTELKTCETQVLTARRTDELETCVVASGLVYGGAQSALGMLFRSAWMHPTRPLTVPSVAGGVAGGMNMIPMISVYDLASVVSRLMSTGGPGGSPPPKRYIIAVDHASRSTTLRDMCVGISKLLGNGQIRDVASPDEADALLLDEEDGAAIAPLQLNLTFETESEGAVDQLVAKEEWKHRDGGLLGNLPFFVRDFVRAMDLRPLKTIVLGAPRVGKSTLASELARKYYLPLLTPQSLLDELFPAGEVCAQGEGAEEGTFSADEDMTKLRDQLAEWKSSGGPIGTIPDAALVALLRWKLHSSACRNQGYVLDGFPVSLDQAKEIFDGSAERGEKQNGEENAEVGGEGSGEPAGPEAVDGETPLEGEGELSPAALAAARTQQILSRLKPIRVVQVPNRVIVLNAPRDLLERRAQNLSEEEAEATGNTQDAFARRAEQFEAESERVADFFERRHTRKAEEADPAAETEAGEASQEESKAAKVDEAEDESGVEVLELHLPADSAFRDELTYDEPIRAYMEQGGAPFNFHPTRDEVRQRKRELENKQREDDERRRREAQEREEIEERGIRARLAADKARLELLEREEAALLEARAKPLRAYLMDTVLPALTEGMLEVVKVQPEDPIDYLAEFLFRKGQEMETQAASEAS